MISDIMKELANLPEGSWIIIAWGFIWVFGLFYCIIKSEL